MGVQLTYAIRPVLEDLQITATPLLSPALLEENWSSYFDRQSDLTTVSRLPVSEEVLKERLALISSVLETLQGLNATLKNPFPSDMFSSDVLLGDNKADIQLAARLFPKAPEQLKQRLGHANWLHILEVKRGRMPHFHGLAGRKMDLSELLITLEGSIEPTSIYDGE
ncbi:uncharacterized protein A1O5_01553 [Cladophialophora psammophila CBS 110553]|uniref:Uncharacterized protein n=1 Tax=Cladophialophora psammophila CBS 110553 TaxID=1182543 RepID=W9X329_9EURO|nr:uncharacterized protein A1O5_01553 [Cladophialophora psammophila CBS 110553]EXJ74857.1 hypothetical protein A1O5_01553 [Cladophialophora psammophila CBS 110553]